MILPTGQINPSFASLHFKNSVKNQKRLLSPVSLKEAKEQQPAFHGSRVTEAGKSWWANFLHAFRSCLGAYETQKPVAYA